MHIIHTNAYMRIRYNAIIETSAVCLSYLCATLHFSVPYAEAFKIGWRDNKHI